MDVLTIPECHFLRDGTPKIAFDFGGSVNKIVYIQKSKDHGYIDIRTQYFPNTEPEKTLAFLRDLGQWGPGEVSAVGVGVDDFKDTLEDILGTSYNLVHEFTGFANCFRWLARLLPKHRMVYKHCADAVAAAEKMVGDTSASFVNWIRSMDKEIRLPMADPSLPEYVFRWPCVDVDTNKPYIEADAELFPCLLIVLGSACTITKISPDGSYSFVTNVSRSGRSILSLASLLLGVADFDEMLDLAAKGDASNVNYAFADIARSKDKEQKQSYRDGFKGDYVCWAYGKALGKSLASFRREDVMRAIICNFLSDIAQVVTTEVQLQGVKRVFFGGGTIAHPLIRSEIIQQLSMHLSFAPKANMEVNFLLHGGFYSAIGALLGIPRDGD